MALERAPYLSLRKSVSDRRWDLDGELSDKSMVDKVQQKLCRQLAEVLMRGMLESGYDFSSRAINSKSKSLSFYTGSNTNYFAPQSRFEEVILLLLISEIIASQLMRINRAEGMRSENGDQHSEVSIGEKTMSINNLKMVHNLLVLVLSNLRQYHLLASIFERSMDFAQEDRYMHLQFSLALICDNRFVRALKTLQHCPSVGPENGPQKEKYILQHMAVISSQDFWLAGRCNLLYAFALSMKAESETCFATKKSLMQESIQSYEKALELDPHDDLAHFFCGLEYSLVRNLDMAQERCQDSLDINLENPSAVMLMALLFTAKKDYKSALELVINSLLDFPSHYGLLVLRLKLEAKYGRIEEALQTSKSLLSFWRKVSLPADCTFDEEASHHNGFSGDSLRAKPSTLTTKMNSKEALVPVTPMFTAPLGISTTTLAVTPSLGASNLDIAETNSMLGQTTTNLSEYGGAASTVSDSMMISSSSNPGLPFSAFRVQANIWVELAEFFLEVDRASDIQACVEEVCSVYPNSHQALYLKGRLFLIRAEKCMDTNAALSKRLKVEAKSCFLGALSIFPAHIPSLTFLSKLYILEHNLKMAEKMMRDVIAIDPLQQKCWHSLGRILAEEQRIEEANECFQTAGSLNFSTPLIPFSVIPRVMKGL